MAEVLEIYPKIKAIPEGQVGAISGKFFTVTTKSYPNLLATGCNFIAYTLNDVSVQKVTLHALNGPDLPCFCLLNGETYYYPVNEDFSFSAD